jgi:DNA-cytosine methyltransferase
MKVSFIDFFAGSGIASLAFRDSGLSCSLAVENNDKAKIVYEQNIGLIPKGDVANLNKHQIPKVDIYFASPPMKAFAKSNQKETIYVNTDFLKFFSFFEIVGYHLPRIVILELLSNIKKIDEGEHLKLLHKTLVSLNYKVNCYDLKSEFFGIPSSKKNIYLIATHKKYPQFSLTPPSTYKSLSIADILDRISIEEDLVLPVEKYHIQNNPNPNKKVQYCGYLKSGKLAEMYVPTTIAYEKIPQCHRIIADTGLFPPFLASENYYRYYIYRTKEKIVSRLSIPEAHAIAGIPSSFIPADKKSVSCLQLGQASCYPVLRFIGDRLMDYLYLKLASLQNSWRG